MKTFIKIIFPEKRKLSFIVWSLAIFFIASSASSADIDPQKLLESVDDNMWSNTKYIEGRLIIDNGRLKRVLEMVSWMENDNGTGQQNLCESFDMISWWVVNLVFYLDETPIYNDN